MRTRSLALAGLLTLAVPVAADAASSKGPSFTVRDRLTSETELRGTVGFVQPSGWKLTAGGGRHTYATYRIVEGACALDLTASVRGKATRKRLDRISPTGPDTLASGTRADGSTWWTYGPEVSLGEGQGLAPGLDGITSIRVADKRYGQLRIQGFARGCAIGSEDAKTLLDPKGPTVRRVTGILRTAKTSLRVERRK